MKSIEIIDQGPLCNRKRFSESLTSCWGGLVDLTVVASAYAMDNVGDESLPVEVTIRGRESLLIIEVTKGLVNMINQDIPQSFLSAMQRDLDIRDAETNAAGGTVLIQKTIRRM